MRSTRLSRALTGAALVSLLVSGAALAGVPTPPEKTTGSVGESYTRDGPLSTAATCRYGDILPLKLTRISVAPPEVRWPDTDSGNDHQHGLVGFQIVVQRSNDQGTTWTTSRVSKLQKAVAYENDPAPLTKRKVNISVSGKPLFRVFSKVTWYKPNGSVRGTLKHWFGYARWSSDQLQGTIEPGPCPNKAAE